MNWDKIVSAGLTLVAIATVIWISQELIQYRALDHQHANLHGTIQGAGHAEPYQH